MKLRALLSVAPLALVCVQASAQSAAAVAPAAPARAAHAPVAPARAAHAAVAHAPAAPAAVPAPASKPAAAAAVAPAAPKEPQEPQQTPAPPSGATTFFFQGNFLGVRTEEVTRENASRYGVSGEPRGVGVREVVKGSPAEKAGLREGDVILRFDGEQVTSARKLTRLIEEAAPDHPARLTVLRGGSEQQLTATLTRREPFVRTETGPLTFYNFGDMPSLHGELLGKPELWEHKGEEFRKRLEGLQRGGTGVFTLGMSRRIGVATSTLGKQLADYFGVPHGVLVNTVEANSPAEKAGLKAGDVLTEVDGKQVSDVDDLVRALGAKEEGEVTLTVFRDRKQRTVRVTPERRQLPQGHIPAPGSLNLVRPPVAGLTLPRTVVTPLARVTPHVITAPRLMATPRVRVTPSAIRVIAPGERIL